MNTTNIQNHWSPEELAVMQKSKLFSNISKPELITLLPCLNGQKKTYTKEEYIYWAGDTITNVGLLLSGRAHIERYDYWGSRHIVHALQPGDLFGESYAASADSTLNVCVQADEDLTVLFLELPKILHMCRSACPFHARLIDNLVSLLANRNVMLNEKLTYITQHSLQDKILAYLSAESIRQHSAYFDIPFDRQQLADYLNADRSALSSALSKLKAKGIIDFQKNHFHLLIPARRES
ncbi:cyclic nucleotide-binding domain-containing protein [Catenisphaera adipataccumulans]|uniref:CRP-like cAMP-binding protein n=1 Tax=Catenisphaera adipataccumulans TaxID=700500 RepID=A0A7W8CXM7_9FIRM|nr:CRP-like cAMP-binding protein [Catenisphaera adipataccumulans]